MNKYLLLGIFVVSLVLFPTQNVKALSHCLYTTGTYEKNIVVSKDSKGQYFFPQTAYGFSSKTKLATGVCPEQIIELSSGILCAIGYVTDKEEDTSFVCNESSFTGTKYTLKSLYDKQQKEVASGQSNVTVLVNGQKTNIVGRISSGKTYVSLQQLCQVIGCQFGYKNGNNRDEITIKMDLKGFSEYFSTFYFELVYNPIRVSYISYLNIGNSSMAVNRFQLKPLEESASILIGDAKELPILGSLNQGTGDLLVPLRVIANGLGKEVSWNGTTKTVMIDDVAPSYMHSIVEKHKVKTAAIIPISERKSTGAISIPKDSCLSVASLNSSGKVLPVTTAFSFYAEDTQNRGNQSFRFQSHRFETGNSPYVGISDAICAKGKPGEETVVVSFSIQSFFPHVATHRFIIDQEVPKPEPNIIINVPIDSRPVTRSNFEPLVKAAGYQYYEVSQGLDSGIAENGKDGSWKLGNPTTVQKQTRQLLQQHANSQTTVILNINSYLFGGLGGSRNPNQYNDAFIFQSLMELQNLVSSYPKVTFYIVYTIPRNKPDERTYDWDKTTRLNETKYEGIRCQIQKQTNNCLVSYHQQMTEWLYFYYLKMHQPALALEMAKTKNYEWADTFYQKFASENAENISLYQMIYDTTLRLLTPNSYGNNSLIDLSNKSNVQLIYGTDDEEVPSSFSSLKDQLSMLPKEPNGEFTKYSLGYSIREKTANSLNNNSKISRLYGADEIHHLILARELNRKDGTTLEIRKKMFTDMNGYYDSLSLSQLMNVYTKFVNGQSNRSGSVYPVSGYFLKITNQTDVTSIKNTILKEVSSNQNVMVVDLRQGNYREQYETFLDKLLEDNVYNIASYGGWNTLANMTGIQFARNLVYAKLDQDIQLCILKEMCSATAVTEELSKRIYQYDVTRMIGIVEDGIYNIYKNGDTSLLTTREKNLNITPKITKIRNNLKNHKLSIGGYQYQYGSVAISSVLPWNRNFEPKITITLNK